MEKDPQTHAIIGAAMEVHTQLGRGFLEPVYHDALAKEFAARKIPFEREVELPVHYKGEKLAHSYRADFLCYDEVIVEVKAISSMGDVEKAQVINYLKASGKQLGLLLNFCGQSLEFERLIRSRSAREGAT